MQQDESPQAPMGVVRNINLGFTGRVTMQLQLMIRRLIIPAAMLALLIVTAAPLQATTVVRMPFENLVLDADLIVRGHCTAKEARWVGGHIETTFKIEVEETLKGTTKSDTLEITMLGGQVDKPVALNQFVPLMPTMYQGEHAVLFLSTKKVKLPADPTGQVEKSDTRLLSSPRVLGLWQGKFTLIKDMNTGTEYVTRYTVENLGFVPNDKISERFNRALQSELARRKNLPTEAELAGLDWNKTLSGKNAVAAQRIENLTTEHKHVPMTLGKLKNEQDVPFMMNYVELKAKVGNVIQKAEIKAERERARQAEIEMMKAKNESRGISPDSQ